MDGEEGGDQEMMEALGADGEGGGGVRDGGVEALGWMERRKEDQEMMEALKRMEMGEEE